MRLLQVSALLLLLTGILAGAPAGRALAAAGPLAVSVGDPALLFTLPAINENAAIDAVGTSRVSLGDFVGVLPDRPARAVVLYFFDRGHGGADLQTLDRLQKRHAAKGVQVLALSVDQTDLGSLSTWLGDLKLVIPVLRDNHRVVQGRYGATDLPLTVIVGADGRVFAIGNPTGAAMEAELEAELLPLVGKDPAPK